jgi:DHA2 family multidrug resistance protein
MIDGMVMQQAAMIAYLDDFKLMFWITLAAVPLLFLLRYRRSPANAPAPVMAD